jgi:hypothetical protein
MQQPCGYCCFTAALLRASSMSQAQAVKQHVPTSMSQARILKSMF